MTSTPRILVLALGNELAGDDAVGLEIARQLQSCLPDGVDIVLSGEAGLALLDHIAGYSHLLVVDAVVTESVAEGSLLVLRPDDLRPVERIAPHYAGLPDLERVARAYGIPFPETVVAVAVAIRQPAQLSEGLSSPLEQAVPRAVEKCLSILTDWCEAK